jgi:hypothetical protein
MIFLGKTEANLRQLNVRNSPHRLLKLRGGMDAKTFHHCGGFGRSHVVVNVPGDGDGEELET